MLNYYAISNNSLYSVNDQELKDGIIEPIWIDINDPTPEEEKLMASIFNISISSDNKIQEIKLPSCYYHQKNEVFVNINLLNENKKVYPVSIILTNDKIITTQSAGSPESKDYINYVIQHTPDLVTPNSIFAYLLEAKINDLDIELNSISHSLEALSEIIFYSEQISCMKEKDLNNNIIKLGQNGHMLSKHHESLISIRRALTFIQNSSHIETSLSEQNKFNVLVEMVALLEERLSFISSKIDFLLNIIYGMIDTEQSSISKVLSIVALIFLPPSLITGIFATSFDVIPLMHWKYGFWFNLALISISAYISYWYCKLKRWI